VNSARLDQGDRVRIMYTVNLNFVSNLIFSPNRISRKLEFLFHVIWPFI